MFCNLVAEQDREEYSKEGSGDILIANALINIGWSEQKATEKAKELRIAYNELKDYYSEKKDIEAEIKALEDQLGNTEIPISTQEQIVS